MKGVSVCDTTDDKKSAICNFIFKADKLKD